MSAVQNGKQYIIMNVGTSTVVDLAEGSAANHTLIHGWELAVKAFDKTTDNQVWIAHLRSDDNEEGWFSFTNRGTGTAIDCGGVINENEPNIWAFEEQPENPNQQWLPYPIDKAGVKVYQ